MILDAGTCYQKMDGAPHLCRLTVSRILIDKASSTLIICVSLGLII